MGIISKRNTVLCHSPYTNLEEAQDSDYKGIEGSQTVWEISLVEF